MGDDSETNVPPKKRGKRREPRYTKDQVEKALRAANGIQAVAARKLGCSRPRITAYLEKWPELRQVRDEAREALIDLVEDKLHQKAKRGHVTALIFLAKTLGKSRGYVERSEVTGPDGGAIAIEDARNMLADRLAKLARQAEPARTNGASQVPPAAGH